MRAKAKKKGNVLLNGLRYLILSITALTMLMPLFWMLSASFKDDLDIFEFPIKWIPEHPILDNYVYMWSRANYPQLFKNTFFLMIVITVLQIFTCSLAAYAFTKIEYPERDKLFLGYLATLMVPFQVIMIPQFIIIRKMGLADTHLALILVQAFSPTGVFLFKQFYMGIPNELSEAARIDGLSEWGIYSKIIFPLLKPAVSSLAIFTSTTVWNDFLAPMIYINSSSKRTIQLGLRALTTEFSTQYGAILAASTVSIIPVVIIFICCQKYLVEGVATSGLKM